MKVTAKRLAVVVLCAVAMVLVATPAFAYVTELTQSDLLQLPGLRQYFADPSNPQISELPDPIPCVACHGTTAGTEVSGPHGNYLSTTNKCRACHEVHQADSVLLLPAATIKGTCETCHDGTGGKGVYGVIYARTSVAPVSDHGIDVTDSIPGGDGSTGGSRTATFSGVGDTLTCSDCHSPHGSNVVAAFTGDRERSADDAVDDVISSARLLRVRPVSATGDVTTYGSDWCGSCHMGRLSGSGLDGNHPVESNLTQATPYTYNNVVRVTTANATTVEMGTLGRNNFGYVMPDYSVGLQAGHDPICQQCHEDGRHVGDNASYQRQIDATEVFALTTVDGNTSTDNPRYQVFPHESDQANLLIETYDDLCLNCHAAPG